MRFGGFVIHGNAAPTLGRCLDSLAAVCDELVAVDSGASDGSAELAVARGARRISHPWEGYGAARAVAARALSRCDYLFFLDSDEWLEPEAIARLRAWKASGPCAPYYTIVRRDWAELSTGRFLFASDPHVRIARPERASWTSRMLVHEALPRGEALPTGALVEHRFATSIAEFRAKEERYALLWAIQAHAEGRRAKWPALQTPAHAVRLGLLKGALFRGGAAGLALAWGFGRYHARKHALSGRCAAGSTPSSSARSRRGGCAICSECCRERPLRRVAAAGLPGVAREERAAHEQSGGDRQHRPPERGAVRDRADDEARGRVAEERDPRERLRRRAPIGGEPRRERVDERGERDEHERDDRDERHEIGDRPPREARRAQRRGGERGGGAEPVGRPCPAEHLRGGAPRPGRPRLP